MSPPRNLYPETKSPLVDSVSLSYPTRSLHFLEALQESPTELIEKDVPQANRKLKVIIGGAGLGGLATAIALRRRGHSVMVFEKAAKLAEVGAGIQIPPNSSRLLLRWGLMKYLESNVVEPVTMAFRRWETGNVIGLTRLIPEFRNVFDAPYYVVHRADLQLAMYRMALESGVEVRLDCGIQTYDPDVPLITLESGETHTADLVVAADGLKSVARKVVLGGKDLPPQMIGFAAYRAVVDAEKMRADPDVSWLLEKPNVNCWIGDMRHVMTYTISPANGETLCGNTFNMVLSHPEDSKPSTWKQETAVADMQQQFKDWDFRLTKIINMIEHTLKWPLMSSKPLKKWIAASGKLIILGDAAHLMLPYMSQGAAMAVEDGAALAEAVNQVETDDQFEEALKVFQRVRILRTSQMQEASLINGKIWHFADGREQQTRDNAMLAEVQGRHFIESPNQFSDPVTQSWAYGYDAEVEMKQAMREHRAHSS